MPLRAMSCVRELGADVVPDGIATGLYYPSRHRDHNRDPLTRAIRASKHDRSHDAQLAARIHAAVLQTWPTIDVDAVVTLPPKPGADDRLAQLRDLVADALRTADAGAVLAQAFDVPGYRAMRIVQRHAAPRRRFVVTGHVSGLRLLLADDVVTSGVQARQAAHALLQAGARSVRFVAAAHAVEQPS